MRHDSWRMLGAALVLGVVGSAPRIALAQDDAAGGGAAREQRAVADGEIKEIDIESLPPPAEEACFVSREIDSFAPLSDGFVLVKSRRNEYYLLTMFPGCIGLGQSLRIALISDLSRVCAIGAPSIAYEGISRTETCPIEKIESVEDRASAERLVELRSRR